MELKAILFWQYSRLALTRLVLGSAAFAAAAGFAGVQSPAAAAPQETVLHSFPFQHDGRFPLAGLTFGKQGVLYGTTYAYGPLVGGTVFQLTPPATGLVQWTETVLYIFPGGKNDGSEPRAGLISGANGALYGTTFLGGTSGNGTVFQLTPPATGLTQWTETVLYSFAGGNDGAWPAGGLIFGANGALYGTTLIGGTSGHGTVFQLTPPATGETQWTETVLYSFTGGNDGDGPITGLIVGANGALYGTTNRGGTSGNGTVFQLTPPTTGLTQWTETVLHSFGATGDGGGPVAGVIFGKNGALYGTTFLGGTSGHGTVFQLTPPATGETQWNETVLYSFTGGNDGESPAAGLIVGKYGALYGTTQNGGTLREGTVFQLTPPAKGKTAWSETVLHNFGGTGDGVEPVAGLIFGGERELALYGTTQFGGAKGGGGTVFLLRR